LFQLTVDKLGKLVNAETDGCCLAYATLPNRRNRIAVRPFIADCVLVQKMHQVPDLLFRTIGQGLRKWVKPSSWVFPTRSGPSNPKKLQPLSLRMLTRYRT
jgi:hypothetical protein